MAGCGREQAGVFQGTQAQETEGRETICVNVIFNMDYNHVGNGKKKGLDIIAKMEGYTTSMSYMNEFRRNAQAY